MAGEEVIPLIDASILTWLIPLTIWAGVWKGIALWRSAKNSHLAWFIVILVLNTAGILPIIYIFAFSNWKKATKTKSVVKSK